MNGGSSGQATSRYRESALLRGLGLFAGPAFALLLLAQQPVAAQSRARPTIRVAPTISAKATSQVALAITVGPVEAIPPRSFIRLHGLPPTAALSDAYSIAPGTWAVALAALANLKIILPVGVSGRSDIDITLVALDGAVLAEAKSVLDVAAPPHQQSQDSAPTPPSDAPMPRPAMRTETSTEATEPHANPSGAPAGPKAPLDRERAQRLMEKGSQELEGGNISAARLFFEYAADAGLAEAAMALAGTFDASELAKLNVRGIKPDATEARRWYERARQLGAVDADNRVRRLGAQ